MEQPPKPMSSSSTFIEDQRMKKGKKRLPTPQELISHYEAQGMDSQQASIKVIEDLQRMLFRVSSSSGSFRKDKLLFQQVSRKMDSAISRLAILEMKLDSKPSYPAAIAMGIGSGAALKGIESVLPHAMNAFGQIWSAVGSINKQQ
ncbi:hypothetical protein CDL15_Pgr007972 [Punica granatum]|uniref:Uncharacterized protein n=1 Tax=Punica granatum TaxID=22663 RepID=A0A218XAG6_PUNGR|nr:hypothetical protein CDL15_Pgr007972 [Punica granatum]